MTTSIEKAIANDLNLCEIGMAMTSGKPRARFVAHRKTCMEAINQMNVNDGLVNINDDDLLEGLMK